MSAELALASIQRRIRGMHDLWRECLSTMDQEQVNHFERPGVLPIAFSVNHMIRIEDQACRMVLRQLPPQWNKEWAERTGVTIDDAGKELPVETMETLRIGNYQAFCDFADIVFDDTEAWLDGLEPAKLDEVMFGGVVPPVFQKAYVARVVGDGPIRVVDGIECWLFQHGIRHLGECEHARALVGLGGLTS